MNDAHYQREVALALADWEALLDAPDRPKPEVQRCTRCGRVLVNPERVADGMGVCCRTHEPHRRQLRYLGTDCDGASLFEIYSLTRGGTTHKHSVSIHFENGEFSCSCEHHKFRGATCKHIERACAWERRRRTAL